MACAVAQRRSRSNLVRPNDLMDLLPLLRSFERIWIDRAQPRSYPKLNKPSTLGLRAHCRTIRPFFRFSLASALGEMAYTCGHRLVEPSASAVYVRRRASRSVLVENGQSLFAFATRYGLFACTRCSIHAGAGLIPLTLTATISITPPQCGQRIGGLGWGCQGSGSTTRSNSCTSCSSFWLLPWSRP